MNVVAHGKSSISFFVCMPQYIIKTKTTRKNKLLEGRSDRDWEGQQEVGMM